MVRLPAYHQTGWVPYYYAQNPAYARTDASSSCVLLLLSSRPGLTALAVWRTPPGLVPAWGPCTPLLHLPDPSRAEEDSATLQLQQSVQGLWSQLDLESK